MMEHFYESRVRLVAEDWNRAEFKEDVFVSSLTERWRENDPLLQPHGFRCRELQHQWYDDLELYLLAAHLPIRAKHADRIVAAFSKAFSRAEPTLDDGDVWYCDMLALSRYAGRHTQSNQRLLSRALEIAAQAVPYVDSDTLAFFTDVYARAAKVLIVDVCEKELSDAEFRAGISKIPYEAFSFFRDSVHFGVTDEEEATRRERLDLISKLSAGFFDQMSRFYRNPRHPKHFVPMRVDGGWAQCFDFPMVLFASGLSYDRFGEATDLVDVVLHDNQSADRRVLRNGWAPSAGRLARRLRGIWIERMRDSHPIEDPEVLRQAQEAKEGLNHIPGRASEERLLEPA